jgi:hypothetical protein
MSRRGRAYHRAKLPPFAPLQHFMTDCIAWKSLKPVSIKAFVQLARLYDGKNNGKLVMSASMLGERIGCSKETAARALTELEMKGFIGVEVVGTYGRKLASEYFLTLYRNDVTGELPTKAFMGWKPDHAVHRREPLSLKNGNFSFTHATDATKLPGSVSTARL